MATVTTRTPATPEDLLAMPDGDRFELVDGYLVERSMGALSSAVGVRLARLIANFNEDVPLGWVFGADCGYQCFPDDPKRVRKPDVSFIRRGRLPEERIPDGHVMIAPDLVVEVISPNDSAYEVGKKVEQYRAAGVPLVWVVNPETRTVLIYRADGTIQGLRERDDLGGEAVLPGFRCRVGDLFPAQPAPGPTAPTAG